MAFLLLFYIGYQVYNANYTSVKTEVAVYVQADDPGTAEIVQATGTAVRKESVIQQQTNGVITYVVEDGGKVSKGGTVAELYATEQDAAAQKQIETLNLQISQLQKLSSPGSTYAVDQDSLTKQISQKLIALLQTSASGEYHYYRRQLGMLYGSIRHYADGKQPAGKEHADCSPLSADLFRPDDGKLLLILSAHRTCP